ncbi:MAG: SH3 domain-containing protein [Helicobacter sp.]|uniref:SH3 domain-containing C40 family peptidase n=1 Tax=Helicobacter sp. TaxID=218 RepID=UPI002A81207D|nr:SH3 domain-containing protein [Helicobacter sp.]MDY4426176.1 SH3 domain-containing protein [Helicobacter sp.]
MMKFLTFIFFLALLYGCASKPPKLELPKQDLQSYISNESLESLKPPSTKNLKNKYLQQFFSPFSKIQKNDSIQAQWGLQQALTNLGYGENLLPYSLAEIEELAKEANFENFPSLKQPAIITKSSNLRVLPTNKPRFFNPKTAGEGFPFDYWQNSYIYLGTPILITHYSKSKKWAFVESGFVSGWIEVLNIAILNQKQTQELRQTQEFLVAKKDNIPIYNTHQEFLETARIGMLLPLLGSTKKVYESFIFTRTQRGYAKKIKIHLHSQDFTRFPMPFSSKNYASLAQNLMGEKYGWGGMFGNRDCSMFLRDTLGNFGFYLQRNSQAQILPNNLNKSLYFDLSQMNPSQKKLFIQNNAIPFATLLGMKGHIMLYVGSFGGEIFVLHDIWGLKTLQNGEEGRSIIGKIALTPLNIGENTKGINQNTLLIKRIYGMRNLFDKANYAK